MSARAMHVFNPHLICTFRKVCDNQEYVFFPCGPLSLSNQKRRPDFQLKYAYSAWLRERDSWKTVMLV